MLKQKGRHTQPLQPAFRSARRLSRQDAIRTALCTNIVKQCKGAEHCIEASKLSHDTELLLLIRRQRMVHLRELRRGCCVPEEVDQERLCFIVTLP